MDDLLAKPLVSAALDATLERWLPAALHEPPTTRETAS
jgi:hypothetical protein